MTLADYINSVSKRFQSGISREHSYRSDLEILIRTLVPEITVTNEPANVTDCGNPDYVLTKGKIPLGYIEAKDVGKDLNSKSYKEQFSRYKKALDNLIITDYLWFQFFQNGELVKEIRIAHIVDGKVIPQPEQYEAFKNQIKDFCTFVGQTIKSAAKLAEMMAAKARLLQNTLEAAVSSDEETQANTSLRGQLASFQQLLIHDIQPKEFADIYAQTLAYGMFAARLHDPTLADFSRQEAAELIPKSNPFLRKLFQYIAGYDIDPRIKTTVDNLAEVFRATDVKALLENFGKSTEQNDPIIHFYETFLAEYDPKLRKQRGVWYTPEPVVKFIVRAVDDILKTEFGLKAGLADTSKTKIKVKTMTKATADRRSKMKEVELEKEVHRVQVLDPATGTGTFLAEVVKHIYNTRFKAMPGIWSSYVEKDLIPRLNGFELLMASYAMAHLKLEMLLKETGYQSTTDQRLKIYLTNSLEPGVQEVPNLFMAQWLTEESAQASAVKQDAPVMVVLGNPPYSGESANKGEWIMNLMEDYKKEPGGKEKLKERNPKWINDDYVKFMRFGQHFIEKNGEGVLAFINPHGYLDNPTFRGMRWNLLKTYDKIYTIDLHGNSKKKEVSPDGSPDVNVFDIQQGVSINLFIKTGKKKPKDLGQVYHYDLYGSRESKYRFLEKNKLAQVGFNALPNVEPMYFMVQKDFESEHKYNKGFFVKDLLQKDSMGITSGKDKIYVNFTYNDLETVFEENAFINKISYRPFDGRYIYYNPEVLARGRFEFMRHMKNRENYAITLIRRSRNNLFNCPLITHGLIDKCIISTLDNANIFPLYLYENDAQELFDKIQRVPNLDPKILTKIAQSLNLTFTPEKESPKNTFAPIDILDYIYAVLHSPTYREKYQEFLKIDFPRVPYPKDAATFWALVKLGGELRQIHLLESSVVENFMTTYQGEGDNMITRSMTKNSEGYEATSETQGKVWINDTQYFDGVPLVAWEFYIGGYQPAQKWLKDRKDRVLDYEDILHYMKIVVALTETERIMGEIDGVEIE